MKRRRFLFNLLLLGVLALMCLVVYFSRQERFLISTVYVSGEKVVDTEKIEQKAQELLNAYYFYLLPRSNIFIYPRQEIKQSLLKTFLRLKSLELNLDKDRGLEIRVLEHVPSALYCSDTTESGDSLATNHTKNCFFIDEEGLIFAPAPSFSEGVYFIYFTHNVLDNPIGQRLLSLEEFHVLSEFRAKLLLLEIQSTAIEIDDSEYHLLMPSGGQIMWRKSNDYSIIYSNLEAFLGNHTIRSQTDFLAKVLYLDLRTTNKVFYKFKEQ